MGATLLQSPRSCSKFGTSRFHLASTCSIQSSIMKTHLCSLIALCVCACGGGDNANPIDATPIDAIEDPRWEALPDVGLGPIQEIGVAELDGQIYVVGGFNGSLGLEALVQVYDPITRAWRTVAPFPKAVHHVNVAAHDGKLYVLGVLIDVQFNESGESWRYDPAADEWTEIAHMGQEYARASGAAAAIDGKIYVAGGLRNSRAIADFSVYDPETDTWNHALAPMPRARDHFVAAAVDGVFYAIGGRDGGISALISEVDAYDPETDTWSPRAPMITARGGDAAAVVDGRIIVFGGEGAANATGVFPEVESYNPVTDTWTALGSMLTPRHGMGAAAHQGTVYIPGGADRRAFAAVATFEAYTP